MQGTLIRAERRERDETTRSMEKRMKLPLARSLACLAILALSATGCVSTVGIDAKRGVPGEMQQFTAELPPYPDVATLMGTEPLAPYRVGPLDGLSVQVFGRPDLGSQKETEHGRVSTVGEDGRIHLPLLGRLEVAGLTRDEIARLVSQRYARIVENAQVEVQVQDCGSVPVDLAGAFVREGRYYLCENLRTVGDVLRAAEGLTEEANPARGTLSRGGVTYRLDAPSVLLEGDASRFDVALERGDILHFPVVGEQQVFVFGQVAAPGPYPIPPQGLTLGDDEPVGLPPAPHGRDGGRLPHRPRRSAPGAARSGDGRGSALRRAHAPRALVLVVEAGHPVLLPAPLLALATLTRTSLGSAP
jgi:protein involved in polysaccharide export with SLBB domain